jgi:hypothetical protein
MFATASTMTAITVVTMIPIRIAPLMRRATSSMVRISPSTKTSVGHP